MKKRRSILFLVGCILLVGLLAGFILFGPHEPAYQGRSLSSWLSDLGGSSFIVNGRFYSSYNTSNGRSEAMAAIRSMGPEAHPYLISMLQAKDGSLRKAILSKLGLQRRMKLGLLTADEKRSQARVALHSLGTNAAVAWKQILLDPTFDRELRVLAGSLCQILPQDAPQMIPVLVQLITELPPAEQEYAVSTITRFGPDAALPMLVKLLQDPDHNVQLIVLQALKGLRPKTQAAILAIAHLLKGSDEEIGLAAANTLLSLDSHHLQAHVYRMHHGELSKRVGAYWMTAREEREPEFVVPELMRGVADPEPEIRQAAAEGLSKFGIAAQQALPALTNLLADSKRYVRVAGTNAINSILPQK